MDNPQVHFLLLLLLFWVQTFIIYYQYHISSGFSKRMDSLKRVSLSHSLSPLFVSFLFVYNALTYLLFLNPFVYWQNSINNIVLYFLQAINTISYWDHQIFINLYSRTQDVSYLQDVWMYNFTCLFFVNIYAWK